MKKRVACMILVMSLSMTGCSADGEPSSDLMKEKKETVVNMYYELSNQYNDLATQYAETQAKLEEVYEEKQINPGITTVGDGAKTLNSLNDMVEFNEPLEYPNTQVIPASGYVAITNNVRVPARDNWTTRLSGSTLYMQHSNGISATLSASEFVQFSDSGIKDIVTGFVSQLTSDEITYSDVFINGEVWGGDAKFPCLVNGNNAVMQCGIVVHGNVALSYIFIYQGDRDITKDEAIKSLLNSVSINDDIIAVE